MFIDISQVPQTQLQYEILCLIYDRATSADDFMRLHYLKKNLPRQ